MVDAFLFTIQLNWLSDVRTYLHIGVFLDDYPLEYERRIALKALHFTLLEGNLHYLGHDRVLRQYLDLNEATIVLTKLHKEVRGGHFYV